MSGAGCASAVVLAAKCNTAHKKQSHSIVDARRRCVALCTAAIRRASGQRKGSGLTAKLILSPPPVEGPCTPPEALCVCAYIHKSAEGTLFASLPAHSCHVAPTPVMLTTPIELVGGTCTEYM